MLGAEIPNMIVHLWWRENHISRTLKTAVLDVRRTYDGSRPIKVAIQPIK